jgi:hypothetical protein
LGEEKDGRHQPDRDEVRKLTGPVAARVEARPIAPSLSARWAA